MSLKNLKLTNTLTGKKEELKTWKPGVLTFYSCGPTVYNLIHIGNLRGGLVADMFFRYFTRAGYQVCYVRNYTDIDDKIIFRGHEEKISPEQVAQKYINEVEKDYAASGMLEPTHKTRVTDHIPEIVAFIQRLLDEGKAYIVEGGEVLFSIDSFPSYGKLSHKKIDDLVAGHRVEVNTKKRNPLDFTLWKPAKEGEPSWDSPWSKGRPGWHIECSAMAEKWLGDRIDVHHGGEDLIFPHHENEIAQTEGATGKEPFVSYWVHHAFLTLSKEKMSKSLGNIFTAREFLTRYSGEVARYMLLSAHYRSIIDFSPESIDQALIALLRIYEAKESANQVMKQARARADLRAETVWSSFAASCEKARVAIDEHFANDLNTPGALGVLFSLIRDFNRTLSEPLAQATPGAILGASELIKIIEEDIGGVLGIGRMDPSTAVQSLREKKAALATSLTTSKDSSSTQATRPTEEEILAKIAERADARKAKDFAKADSIRQELESRGILIKDSLQGTVWIPK